MLYAYGGLTTGTGGRICPFSRTNQLFPGMAAPSIWPCAIGKSQCRYISTISNEELKNEATFCYISGMQKTVTDH
jgi:hypothetical protein